MIDSLKWLSYTSNLCKGGMSLGSDRMAKACAGPAVFLKTSTKLFYQAKNRLELSLIFFSHKFVAL